MFIFGFSRVLASSFFGLLKDVIYEANCEEPVETLFFDFVLVGAVSLTKCFYRDMNLTYRPIRTEGPDFL